MVNLFKIAILISHPSTFILHCYFLKNFQKKSTKNLYLFFRKAKVSEND
jgi:hypothetical protein